LFIKLLKLSQKQGNSVCEIKTYWPERCAVSTYKYQYVVLEKIQATKYFDMLTVQVGLL